MTEVIAVLFMLAGLVLIGWGIYLVITGLIAHWLRKAPTPSSLIEALRAHQAPGHQELQALSGGPNGSDQHVTLDTGWFDSEGQHHHVWFDHEGRPHGGEISRTK